jgi:hypothetical protein
MLLPVLVLLLAACTPAPATSTPLPDAAATVPPAATEGLLIVTRAPLTPDEPGALAVPGAGTLVASETEDPNADILFTQIQLVRTRGGDAPERSEIVLNGDGSFTFNGQAGRITPERVQAIQTAINTVNFFGMQATLLNPAATVEEYTYSLTITRAGITRAIASNDGFMPNEYVALLALVLEAGLRPG